MTKKKIKELNEQRPFILVYHDFLESDLIKTYEKIVFIALKKFANSNDKCFPSLKKLSEITGLSKRKVQDTLKELEEKQIISIESRTSTNGGKTSNLYTLYDFKELWSSKSVEEVEKAKKNNFVNLNEVSTEMLLAELERRNKEKEPETEEPTKVATVPSTQKNQSNTNNNTTTKNKSQTFSVNEENREAERYTHEQIKELYEYDIMVADEPTKQSDIDTVIEILHTTLNTTKNTIRVGRENKPTMSVISKLMKLDKDCILYAIEKFGEQTGRIKNPTNYMLTLLYNAKEQMNLDITNKVQFDMYNNNNAMCDDSTSSNSDVKDYEPPEQQEPKQPTKASSPKTTNRFNNFPQREYSKEEMKEIEAQTFHKKEKEESKHTLEEMRRLKEKYPNLYSN